MGQFFRGENGKLGVIFLSATGTQDPTKLPFRQAERANQGPASAIALLAQNTHSRLSIAKWTERARVTIPLHSAPQADELRVGLKKSSAWKFAEACNLRLVASAPEIIQEFGASLLRRRL